MILKNGELLSKNYGTIIERTAFTTGLKWNDLDQIFFVFKRFEIMRFGRRKKGGR